ncbi:hypothetical protein KEM54_000143 [Ascosphaera aggregata]|nr:hypothetical protein KEM54_000143 [Ascosphaera aggregata]
MNGPSPNSLEYRIGLQVHSLFDALPPNCKPRVHANGIREWIPLSATVLVSDEDTQNEVVTVISIATGAKCLSTSQVVKCNGLVLHDSHAEVLALRGFNHWLLKECRASLSVKAGHEHEESSSSSSISLTASPFLQFNTHSHRHENGASFPPFRLQPNVSIYMYGTCAPCGDASMELTMAAQEDATPWSRSEKATEPLRALETTNLLDGRGYFSQLGVVRRKPSRADAEPTLSKSCSDKLAMKQVTSALSTLTSALVAPTENAYIKGFILPDNEVSDIACARAFGDGEAGRLRHLKGMRRGEESMQYALRTFEIRTLREQDAASLWQFGKSKDPAMKTKIGNISVIWIAGTTIAGDQEFEKETREVVINGVRQGFNVSSPNPKKGSCLCRAKMWDLLRDVYSYVNRRFDDFPIPAAVLSGQSYAELKEMLLDIPSCSARREALRDGRTTLGDWVENRGDDFWGLNVLTGFAAWKQMQREMD